MSPQSWNKQDAWSTGVRINTEEHILISNTVKTTFQIPHSSRKWSWCIWLYFDMTSCHVSIKMIRESLLVGYCLYFSSLVPQNFFEYTLSLYISLAFSFVKVKKFWFFSQSEVVIWHSVYVYSSTHTHSDAFAQANNTSRHNNNKYKYKKK